MFRQSPLQLIEWQACLPLYRQWEKSRLMPKTVVPFLPKEKCHKEGLKILVTSGFAQLIGPGDKYAQLTEAGKVKAFIELEK